MVNLLKSRLNKYPIKSYLKEVLMANLTDWIHTNINNNPSDPK